MEVIKKVLVVLGFFSAVGVLLGLGLSTTAFFTSGVHVSLEGSIEESSVPFGGGPIGHALWDRLMGPVWVWMLGGAVGVFFLGFYFSFAARTKVQRVLTALCFLSVWAGVVFCLIPDMLRWLAD